MRKELACALIICCIPFPCRGEAPVATIGATGISADYFRAGLIAKRTGAGLGTLAESMTDAGKKKLAEELLDLKLVSARARAEGIDRIPKVRGELELAADSVLVEAYLKREVGKLDSSEAGLKRFYLSHPDDFRSEPRVKAAHIVTATREEALQAREKVLAGTDFNEVASRVNVDSTRQLRGNLGWVKRGIFVKNFEEVLFALKPGEVSGVVKTEFGYHVVKAEEVDPGTVKPFEAVQGEVAKVQARECVERIKKELRGNREATVDLNELKEQ